MSARNTPNARESGSSPGLTRLLVLSCALAGMAVGPLAWSALQGNTTTNDLPGGNNHTRSIAIGDLNCDTFPDIVVANEDNEADQIIWGNGDGTFQAPIELQDRPQGVVYANSSDSVDLADIDQDGDLDIVIGSAQSTVPNRLYVNENVCDGTFDYLGNNAIGNTFGNQRTADARFGDVNGDGDPDIVVANRGVQNYVFLGGSNTGFPTSGNLPNSGGKDSSSVAIGDLNGDNRPEVVIGNRENARNDVYINNGNTTTVPYSNRFDLSPDANYTDWVAIADLNNDGWNDVVIANREQPNQYLINNGSGVNSDLFGPTRQISADSEYTRELRVVDVDNDGDLDVITIANADDFNKLYLNLFIENGQVDVAFSDGIVYTMDTLESTTLAICDPNAIPACDLDGDGDLDIVTGNNTNSITGVTVSPNQVHFNENEPPSIISEPVEGAVVGVLYEYTIVAADPDFDQVLTVPLGSATYPAWITGFDTSVPRQLTVSGTPQVGDVGDHNVSFVANDGTTDSPAQSFSITVALTGTAPVLAAISDPLNVTQGPSAVNVAISATDDGPVADLDFSAPIAPDWVQITNNGDGTASIDGNPGQNDIGNYPLTIRVTDGADLVDEQSLVISVADGNDRPVASDDLICLENWTDPTSSLAAIHPYYAATTVLWNDTDIDGDTLSFTGSITQGPTNGMVSMNPDGTFTYTPDGSGSTSDSFRYQITDGNGGQDRGDVDVRLVSAAECQEDNNATPVFTVDPLTIELNLGDPWDDAAALAGVSATDPEDGNLTASIVLTANPVDTDVAGEYVVSYEVTDSGGKVATATRTVTVISDDAPPEITILGDDPATVNVGDTYTDAGATAEDAEDGDLTGSIIVDDQVDTSTIGTYQVNYSVTDSAMQEATASRTVNVVDGTAPVITITGSNPVTVVVGTGYTDEGATAADNVDGDVSGSIVTDNQVDPDTVGSYAVTYTVSDSAGNQAMAIRTVNVVAMADTTPPVITVDPLTVTLDVGDPWDDAAAMAGVSATDDVDGDISDQIVIGGDTVNTNMAGTYDVTYNVSDASGNAADEVTRTVTVNAATPPPNNGGGGGGGGGGGAMSAFELLGYLLLLSVVMSGRHRRLHRRST